MKRLRALLFGVVVLAAFGCDHLTPEDFEENKMRPEDFFNFATVSSVKVDLDYGPLGGQALLEIYGKDPIENPDELPLFMQFADAAGKVESRLSLPGHVKDSVFVYSGNIGVPQCVPVHIENEAIRFKVENNYDFTPSSETKSLTKVVSNPTVRNKSGKFNAIVDADNMFGKPADFNKIVKEGPYNNDDMKVIQALFWNGKSKRPDKKELAPINLPYAQTKSSEKNVTTAAQYVQDGQIVPLPDAELFLTFIYEDTDDENVLGYYFYPTDTPPASPADLKKYVVLPNVSVPFNNPYPTLLLSAFAPISTNTEVQLLYEDADGNVSTKFPPGVTVGFFVIQKGWDKGLASGKFDFSQKIYYSNNEWNEKGTPRMMMRSTDAYKAYGVELGSDNTFDEIIFNVRSNPVRSIINEGEVRPVPPEPDPVMCTAFATYCYEDMWPSGGDYDMNDVAIEHECNYWIDVNNNVTQAYDFFTVVSGLHNAEIPDAFAFIIPPAQRGSMIMPQCAVKDDGTNAIILFKDAREHLSERLQLTRYFEKGELSKDAMLKMTDLDPFIIPTIDDIGYTDRDRREVHLPKKSGTSKINAYLLGMDQEAYFINKDGKHPFAISLPVKVSDGTYKLPQEMYSIEKEYPMFTTWAQSSGTQATDWYLHYRGN